MQFNPNIGSERDRERESFLVKLVLASNRHKLFFNWISSTTFKHSTNFGSVKLTIEQIFNNSRFRTFVFVKFDLYALSFKKKVIVAIEEVH